MERAFQGLILVRNFASKAVGFRGTGRKKNSGFRKPNFDAGVSRRFQALRASGHQVELDKLNPNDPDLGFHEDEYFKETDSVHAEDNTVKKMGMTKAMEFRMIEKKYFKDRVKKEPNFLTWVAKEKIRYLHHEDPETWTPEKLAQSFPCSVKGIKDILKSKWMPKDEEELRSHDEKVSREWELLGKKFGGPLSVSVQNKLLSGEMEGSVVEPEGLITGRKASHLPNDGEFFGLLAERVKPWSEDLTRKDVLRLMSSSYKGDDLMERRTKSFFHAGNRKFTQVDSSVNSRRIRYANSHKNR